MDWDDLRSEIINWSAVSGFRVGVKDEIRIDFTDGHVVITEDKCEGFAGELEFFMSEFDVDIKGPNHIRFVEKGENGKMKSQIDLRTTSE